MSIQNQSDRRPPRICACVLMNHPFPANLPLLRRILEGRFSEVRFLIPFERLPDQKDVITVYRGSYSHAGYINDAWSVLRGIDCDYYLLVHDDVLLHPGISEETFLDYFPLGLNDGFLPRVHGMPGAFGNWIWYSTFLPRLLHPKSQLFGSGIELANLLRYLPDADTLRLAMAANGVTPAERVTFDSNAMDDIARWPSRVLLHGLQGALPQDDMQASIDRRSLEIARLLNDVLLDANRDALGGGESDEKTLALPIPVVQSGYLTDFYILPRSRADEFQHYMGVAAAANLFVEIIAPTILHACCERVWTGAHFGLDFAGFDMQKPLGWLTHPRATAIHPIKLSMYRDPQAQEAFLTILDGIRKGERAAAEVWPRIGALPPGDAVMNEGWHAMEDWGLWAEKGQATFRMALPSVSMVSLKLRAPLHPALERLTGRIEVENGIALPIEACWPNADIEIILDRVEPGQDGMALLRLISDHLIVPGEVMPNTDDDRTLGFGLISAQILQPV